MTAAVLELGERFQQQNVEVESVPAATTVRVALAGCGVVGSALVGLVESHRTELLRRHRIRIEFTSILVNHIERRRAAHVPTDLLTDDVDEFLAAPADIVAEATVGVVTAYRIACASLRSGRRFVTANKALVAAHGPQLSRLAAENKATFHFEPAVGGAIPIVRCLREAAAGIGVKSVRGVLNGTCNYVLTRVDEGAGYAEALAEAQVRGFAEPDPSRDVSGEDAADKVRVLAWLAFGVDPANLPVWCRGIGADAEKLISVARAAGGVLKLIGECHETSSGIVATVEPTVVSADSEIARVQGEENVFLVGSESADAIVLRGKGAGGIPTAGALLGDLLRAPAGLPTPELSPVIRNHGDGEDLRELRWLVTLPRTFRRSRTAGGARDTFVFHAPYVSEDIGDARALFDVWAKRGEIAELKARADAAGIPLDAVRWEQG